MADTFEKFTERARKVFSLAQEEAQRFNHNYIGTEHLLLGLVREGDGIAARVLANLGVQLPKVRSAVEFIIGRGDGLVREGEGIAAGVLESLGVSLEKVRQQVMQVVSQPPSYQAPPSSDPKPGSSTIICRVDLPASDYVRLWGIAKRSDRSTLSRKQSGASGSPGKVTRRRPTPSARKRGRRERLTCRCG